ncbi:MULTISPECIES: triose-phosphate isomerase [unclassified Modicisalibacter]|uniref:triose-phosphate isomerase n=1 Tax=unclassified Modicisalibacter TaxID=2679913 RepID=UPI001CCF7543|nr:MULTISPECIES: triose-phosphate isomerase [unclassified Modicisalibacter]MBZ9558281.1 triose-phosphate isomerase [Modicisalibacter sp. R2A 31.J]MBZ9577388.1 triose-phosphate isomerase [Modicisalibacter sp. MOD 31.J]
MRMPLIAGNWKMNGSLTLVERFGEAFAEAGLSPSVEVCLIPPFPYLAAAQRALGGTPVMLGAQTLNPQHGGAHTGEVSGGMLREFGVDYVLVGHSERRALYRESDNDVYDRLLAALTAELRPILCVGETLEERDAGRTRDVVLRQVGAVMARLEPAQRAAVTIAYEPVWAIGTGRTATPEQAQEVMSEIRAYQAGFDRSLAEGMRLLYGGSMNADNAAELLAQPDIDGGLVGGASLKVDDFLAICQSAG